jgi:hypothetical protein
MASPPVTSEIPIRSRSQSLAMTQLRVLGVFWIVYGILRLAMTVWLVTFTTTATLMFGALLTRVPDPYSLMSLFHFLYLGVTIWSGACGILGMLAGASILASQRSARTLAIVAALLSLSELPFGIALGAYTLILLVPAAPIVTGSTRRE